MISLEESLVDSEEDASLEAELAAEELAAAEAELLEELLEAAPEHPERIRPADITAARIFADSLFTIITILC